jgi:Family of unknown function (DUF6992)
MLRNNSDTHSTIDSMFADTLLHAEQMHMFRLLVWGGASIIVGTLAFVGMAWRGLTTALLRQFAMQMIGWGVVEVVYVVATWHGLALRDVSGATRLDRLLWFNLGLNAGAVGIGGAIALAGWFQGRRLGALGAGLGVIVQSTALFVINAKLVAIISR